MIKVPLSFSARGQRRRVIAGCFGVGVGRLVQIELDPNAVPHSNLNDAPEKWNVSNPGLPHMSRIPRSW